MGVLTLLRHGRTAANKKGLLQGRVDNLLDELGHEQARAAASALAPVDHVVSSPLARARQTAAAFGAPVEIDDRWVELDYGDFDGKPLSEITPETWERWRLNIHFRPPNGETVAELGHRVRRSLEEWEVRARDSHVVIVSHVSPIKAALAWALGTSDVIAWRCFLDPASVTRIETGANGPVVVRFNDTTHLADLVDEEGRRRSMEGWSGTSRSAD